MSNYVLVQVEISFCISINLNILLYDSDIYIFWKLHGQQQYQE
jgi:hypothetical protein